MHRALPARLLRRYESHRCSRFSAPEWPRPGRSHRQPARRRDAVLASSPGEMFAEFGLTIKAAASERGLVCLPVSLANGYSGYIPTRRAFDEGGYETWLARSSFLAPDTGEAWLVAAEDLLGVC